MKKIYLDETEWEMCIAVIASDAEVIRAGTTVCSMPVTDKNSEYKRFAEEYNINFIFDDNRPIIDFYSIPLIDIFAIDSKGGYIGSLGQRFDLESDAPICYIDCNKKSYMVAKNGTELLQNVSEWKKQMKLCNNVKFYSSKAEAEKENEFLNRKEIEESLKKLQLKDEEKQ